MTTIIAQTIAADLVGAVWEIHPVMKLDVKSD
jgi:hypothetical protein